MAVKLRLLRMGAKRKPFYRIVAADSRVKRDGKYIELVGTYNPVAEPAEINIKEDVALNGLKMELFLLIQLKVYLIKKELIKNSTK